MKLEHAMLALMLVVGMAAWWLYLTPSLDIDTSRLAELPPAVGSWVASEIPMEEGVERILRADFNLQRAYHSSGSDLPIWLYVGYYGTERGGRPEHTPDFCYPSAGWEIVEETTIDLDDGSGLRGVEFVVRLEDTQRLVHFWYRGRTRTGLVGLLPLGLEHLRGRALEGRADGALVRISTPLDPADPAPARERLRAFAPIVDAQITAHWPDELPGA